jgi:hypothetical protein
VMGGVRFLRGAHPLLLCSAPKLGESGKTSKSPGGGMESPSVTLAFEILERIGEDIELQPHRLDELFPRYQRVLQILNELRP